MELYLGLDGGGTKTAACILNAGRRELGRGLGGPCNILTGDDALLHRSILDAASSALESASLPPHSRFAAVCAGVAGCTAKRRRAEFLALLRAAIPADRHRVDPDYAVAWWGATAGEPGIVVIAGTGAVVYGRNEEGEEARWDGRGFLFGDAGSAFYVGHLVLKLALGMWDTGRELPPFLAGIMGSLGIADGDELIEWVHGDFQPSRIAGIAKMVADHAAEGDQLACKMLTGAGHILRTSYEMVRKSLHAKGGITAYALGSMWLSGPWVRDGFRTGLVTLPSVEPLEPLHDPAYGAALFAMQQPE